MGVSSNGQISYGISFDDGFQFPWDEDEWEGDIEKWWIYGVMGYKNPIELYTKEGEYLNGVEPSKADCDLYYDTRRKFLEENPIPVELVNSCSGDYPMYILSIPGTETSCSRGYPTEFNPEDLKVTEAQKDNLIKFCKDHGIEFEGEPKWYLSSYMG